MFVRPEEVIKNFGLEPGMMVADFGCGLGHYSLAAAKRVAPNGVVYAIDVQKELLQSVKSQAELDQIKNLQIIWADLEVPNGSRLNVGALDFIIISNILFQAQHREQLAKEAFRILKDGGKTGIIEWEPYQKDLALKAGPPPEKRISQEEIKKIFMANGFKIDKEFVPGDDHYGLIFRKA